MNPFPSHAVLACLSAALAAPAQSAPGAASEKPLAYTADYERYRCKLEASRQTYLQDRDQESLTIREQTIQDRFEGRIDNPYPAEFHDHVPGAYRLAERILLPLPCEAKPIDLPKGFRCRLDHLVLRAQTGGREFRVEAASVDFGFRYIQDNKEVVSREPLALRHGNPQPYGGMVLRGRSGDRVLHLARSWALGFPKHSLSAQADVKNFTPDRAEALPFVTRANSRLYVFDFAGEDVQAGEPLQGLTLVPARCRT